MLLHKKVAMSNDIMIVKVEHADQIFPAVTKARQGKTQKEPVHVVLSPKGGSGVPEMITETVFNTVIDVADDTHVVVATDGAKVRLYGSARADVVGDSVIEAHDSASVFASNAALVNAYDNAVVVATGETEVMANDYVTVIAKDHSAVLAVDSSAVYAYDNAQIAVTADQSNVTVTVKGGRPMLRQLGQ